MLLVELVPLRLRARTALPCKEFVQMLTESACVLDLDEMWLSSAN